MFGRYFRHLLFFLVLLVISTGAVAAQDVVTVNFWIFSDYATGEALDLNNQFIAEFEAANPGIEINMVGRPAFDMISSVLVGAGSGENPDVITTLYAFSGPLIKAGLIADLSSDFSAMPEDWQAQYPDWSLELLTKDGKLYGLPYSGTGSVLFRNLTVLEQSGIDPEAGIKDWTDWLAQAQKIHDAGFFASGRYYDQTWGQMHFYGGIPGAQMGINPDGTTMLDAEKYATALEFMEEIQQYGTDVSVFDQAGEDLFLNNQMAFFVGGPWYNPTFEQAAETSGFKYDITAVPGQVEGEYGAAYGGEYLAILDGPQKEAAFKWAAFLTDAQQMTRFALGLNRYIQNNVVLENPDVKSSPLIQMVGFAYANGVPEGPVLEDTPPDFYQAMIDAANLVHTGALSAQDAAEQAVQMQNEVLADR